MLTLQLSDRELANHVRRFGLKPRGDERAALRKMLRQAAAEMGSAALVIDERAAKLDGRTAEILAKQADKLRRHAAGVTRELDAME